MGLGNRIHGGGKTDKTYIGFKIVTVIYIAVLKTKHFWGQGLLFFKEAKGRSKDCHERIHKGVNGILIGLKETLDGTLSAIKKVNVKI